MRETEHCRYCGSPRDLKAEVTWRCRRCGALVPGSEQPAHGDPIPFGPYTLVRRIAAGGMGVVYEARRGTVQGFEKTFALKRLLPAMSSDNNFVDMLVDEAKICAPLEHPNIVQVFELERLGAEYYIAMEYIAGGTLATLLRFTAATRRMIPAPVVLHILGEAIKGLAHAHGSDYGSGAIIHRDVSPQNIMLARNGQVKLTDFGIAKAMASSTVSRAGTLKGKLAYMAPEVLSGERVTPATDVFAMGVLMHEAFTSRRLFRAESEAALISAVLRGKVSPLNNVRKDVPEAVEQVILKALARDKKQRYQNGVELRDAFLNALAFEPQGPGLKTAERYIAEYYKIVGLPGQPLDPALDTPHVSNLPQAAKPEITEPAMAQQSLQNDDEKSDAGGFVNNPTVPSVVIEQKQSSGIFKWFAAAALLVVIAALLVYVLIPSGQNLTNHDAAVMTVADAAQMSRDAAVSDHAQLAKPDAQQRIQQADAGKTQKPAHHTRPIRNKLSSRDILKVFRRHVTAFNRCGALDAEHAAQGHVKVSVTIDSRGRVQNSSIQPASLKGRPLEKCLQKEVRKMRFPRNRQKQIKVTVPLQFQIQ